MFLQLEFGKYSFFGGGRRENWCSNSQFLLHCGSSRRSLCLLLLMMLLKVRPLLLLFCFSDSRWRWVATRRPPRLCFSQDFERHLFAHKKWLDAGAAVGSTDQIHQRSFPDASASSGVRLLLSCCCCWNIFLLSVVPSSSSSSFIAIAICLWWSNHHIGIPVCCCCWWHTH